MEAAEQAARECRACGVRTPHSPNPRQPLLKKKSLYLVGDHSQVYMSPKTTRHSSAAPTGLALHNLRCKTVGASGHSLGKAPGLRRITSRAVDLS